MSNMANPGAKHRRDSVKIRVFNGLSRCERASRLCWSSGV